MCGDGIKLLYANTEGCLISLVVQSEATVLAHHVLHMQFLFVLEGNFSQINMILVPGLENQQIQL